MDRGSDPEYSHATLWPHAPQHSRRQWPVSCERCSTVAPLSATTVEEGSTAATALGWMDQARRGVCLERWRRLYSACPPGTPQTLGTTTR